LLYFTQAQIESPFHNETSRTTGKSAIIDEETAIYAFLMNFKKSLKNPTILQP
jgi:hypothetical protein